MKNNSKSKLLFSIFVDFIIIVVLLSLTCGSIFVAKKILYPEETDSGEIKIRTELMPKKFESSLDIGDTVFDTLTKRRVGEVIDKACFHDGDDIYFVLTLDARFYPRSKSLRTSKLWFYFKGAKI